MVNEMAVTRIDGAIKKLGEFLIRYGLVLVLGWIGAMKFTSYEAAGIQGLVASSPLMSWMYKVFSRANVLMKVIGIILLERSACCFSCVAVRKLCIEVSATVEVNCSSGL